MYRFCGQERGLLCVSDHIERSLGKFIDRFYWVFIFLKKNGTYVVPQANTKDSPYIEAVNIYCIHSPPKIVPSICYNLAINHSKGLFV